VAARLVPKGKYAFMRVGRFISITVFDLLHEISTGVSVDFCMPGAAVY